MAPGQQNSQGNKLLNSLFSILTLVFLEDWESIARGSDTGHLRIFLSSVYRLHFFTIDTNLHRKYRINKNAKQ